MSSLNLYPNIVVVVTQAGIFGATFLVIKKTILDPYMSVRKRRHEMTAQKKEQAIQVLKKHEEETQRVQTEINLVTTKAKTLREEMKREAIRERERILVEAQKSAEARIEKTKSEIGEALSKEREKLPEIVSTLTKEFYDKILN